MIFSKIHFLNVFNLIRVLEDSEDVDDIFKKLLGMQSIQTNYFDWNTNYSTFMSNKSTN